MRIEEPKVEFHGKDIYPTIKEVCFTIGMALGSMVVGYALVSGKFRGCMDVYQVVGSKIKYP